MTNLTGDNQTLTLLTWYRHCTKEFSGKIYSRATFRWSGLALAIVNFSAGSFSLCFNSLVLYVFFKNRHLHDVSRVLAVMLSTGDILAAFTQMNSVFLHGYMAYDVNNVRKILYCRLFRAWVNFTLISALMSTTIIFGITSDRYMAVLHPIHYRTSKKVVFKKMAIVFSVWIFSIPLVFLQKLPTVRSTMIITTFAWLYLYCFYAYTRIYRRLMTLARTAGVENLANVTRQRKLFVTSFLVMAVFLVCYIPILVTGWTITNGFDTKEGIVESYLLPWITTFFYASSTANPCIYCLRNPRLSPIIMSYLNRCFCRRRRVTQGRNSQEDAT